MSANQSTVCRLLGGTGRAPLQVVRTKIPALLLPSRRSPAGVIVLHPEPLPLAAWHSARMDKHLWMGLLRLIDEGSPEELQRKKEELLEALDRQRIGRGTVRNDVMRVVGLIEEELMARHARAERRKARR